MEVLQRNTACLQAQNKKWDHKIENEDAKMLWVLNIQTDEHPPHPDLTIVDKEGKHIWKVGMATPGGRRREEKELEKTVDLERAAARSRTKESEGGTNSDRSLGCRAETSGAPLESHRH